MNIVTNDYAWSTHQPLINAVVEDLKPNLVVELGIGNFSTPLFLKKNIQYIGIENDKDWLDYIKSKFMFNDNSKLIHHDIGVDKAVFLKDLSEKQKEDIKNFYKDFLEKNITQNTNKIKLLFVDNHTCCRKIAINTLGIMFDIIIYHDCEPDGIAWYEYYFDNNIIFNYDKYLLKTMKSWTGMFIKKNITHNLFQTINKYIEKYQNENNALNIFLEKCI